MPTRFLLARLHRARVRALVAGHGIPAELVPEPLMIACPACGDEFFTDIGPDEGDAIFIGIRSSATHAPARSKVGRSPSMWATRRSRYWRAVHSIRPSRSEVCLLP